MSCTWGSIAFLNTKKMLEGRNAWISVLTSVSTLASKSIFYLGFEMKLNKTVL